MNSAIAENEANLKTILKMPTTDRLQIATKGTLLTGAAHALIGNLHHNLSDIMLLQDLTSTKNGKLTFLEVLETLGEVDRKLLDSWKLIAKLIIKKHPEALREQQPDKRLIQ